MKPYQLIYKILQRFKFSELADYEKNVNNQVYKYNAYKKAAKSIIELTDKIKSGKDARRLVL